MMMHSNHHALYSSEPDGYAAVYMDPSRANSEGQSLTGAREGPTITKGHLLDLILSVSPRYFVACQMVCVMTLAALSVMNQHLDINFSVFTWAVIVTLVHVWSTLSGSYWLGVLRVPKMKSVHWAYNLRIIVYSTTLAWTVLVVQIWWLYSYAGKDYQIHKSGTEGNSFAERNFDVFMYTIVIYMLSIWPYMLAFVMGIGPSPTSTSSIQPGQ